MAFAALAIQIDSVRSPARTPISNGKSWAAKAFVAMTNGKLDLGPWEQIFYGECDGKRRKRVLVKIIGE